MAISRVTNPQSLSHSLYTGIKNMVNCYHMGLDVPWSAGTVQAKANIICFNGSIVDILILICLSLTRNDHYDQLLIWLCLCFFVYFPFNLLDERFCMSMDDCFHLYLVSWTFQIKSNQIKLKRLLFHPYWMSFSSKGEKKGKK